MTGQANIKCIYCKCEITESNKSNEHVFPQSFGCPDTWTMDCVCRGCNIAFGQSIERYLARDSLEGLWALKKIGSRSGKPIRQMRIKLNVPDEDKYGEFRGAIVYADFSQKGGLLLPAQILLKDDQGNLADLPSRLLFTLQNCRQISHYSEFSSDFCTTRSTH